MSDQVESPVQEEHIVNCIKSIDDYRGQNISKWEAVLQISSALQLATASMDIEQRTTARRTYLTMLDEHDQMLTSASAHGGQGPNQIEDGNNEQEEEFIGENGTKHSQSQSSLPSSVATVATDIFQINQFI